MILLFVRFEGKLQYSPDAVTFPLILPLNIKGAMKILYKYNNITRRLIKTIDEKRYESILLRYRPIFRKYLSTELELEELIILPRRKIFVKLTTGFAIKLTLETIA